MADESAFLAVVNKLFRVLTTMGEMAQDRGYLVAPDAIPSTMEDFRSRFEGRSGDSKVITRENMAFLCHHRESNESMLVAFCGEDSFTIDHFKRFDDQARGAGAKRMIIVISGKLVATSKRRIEEASRSELAVKTQLFSEDDVVVNITHHELVPQHVPLSEDEVKEVLTAHSLEKSMLPRMLVNDPIALYFGLERGNVVKISRKSESAGKYVTYRQVV
mmetsp:Transcript_50848/g.58468  ORF Transcript_50848/g.58468 Transcript_50848/m.58468 type:complete len:218 (-) Transcript_50848:44-697(-)